MTMNDDEFTNPEVKLRGDELKEAKLEVLADAVESLRPLYNSEATTETQKGLLETMIGAGLWYVAARWTGKISVGAIKAHDPKSGIQEPKLTKEHEYPRKVAGREMLENRAGGNARLRDEILALYENKYGLFNYVTPIENRSLRKYQESGVFDKPADAYEKAGITLVAVTKEELADIKKRNREVIERLLSNL